MDTCSIIFGLFLAGGLAWTALQSYFDSEKHMKSARLKQQEKDLDQRERQAVLRARQLDIERMEKLLEEESQKNRK